MSSPIKRRFAIFALLLLIASGYFFLRWFEHDRHFESTENAYVHAEITRIASELDTRIDKVHVTDNQRVNAGDLLVSLETDAFLIIKSRATAHLAMRQAELAQTRAKLDQHLSLITAHQAQTMASNAAFERVQVDLDRAQALLKPGYVSAERITSLSADHKIASAQLAKANADLDAQKQNRAILEADILRLEAMVEAAQSELDQAELYLRKTKIYAPISGFIGQRAARNGQLVQSGSYLLSIVPTNEIWIQANFKETQIERLKAGLVSTVIFDSFPSSPVKGHVDSLFAASGAQFSVLPPDNATGNFTKVVQRIPVKIMLVPDHPLQGLIRPGMSARVSVDTRNAK